MSKTDFPFVLDADEDQTRPGFKDFRAVHPSAQTAPPTDLVVSNTSALEAQRAAQLMHAAWWSQFPAAPAAEPEDHHTIVPVHPGPPAAKPKLPKP